MITEVTMPVLGLTMEQGTIVGWLKEVGDRVDAGEALFMVETDKATSDAPAPAAGILARVLFEEGDAAAVGAVVALLAETPEDIAQAALWRDAVAAAAPAPSSDSAQRSESTPPPGLEAAPGPTSQAAPTPNRLFASPRARARARELGIPLSAATDGRRLTEREVLAMAITPGAEVRKLSRIRSIIAERMTLSATSIPQVTYTLRCDISEAMALRRSLKAGTGAGREAVSLDALIVRAAAIALTEFPLVNSQWVEGEGIRVMPEVNVAVAVDLENDGLVTPVVDGADRRDIRATAAELDRLVTGARAGTLGPDDYSGGTFTVTSLASLGVETFNPIIVPPQAAILGVGAIVPTPVFRQEQVIKCRLLALSLTTDHRILDGAPSARFLSRIRDLLEQPARLGG